MRIGTDTSKIVYEDLLAQRAARRAFVNQRHRKPPPASTQFEYSETCDPDIRNFRELAASL